MAEEASAELDGGDEAELLVERGLAFEFGADWKLPSGDDRKSAKERCTLLEACTRESESGHYESALAHAHAARQYTQDALMAAAEMDVGVPADLVAQLVVSYHNIGHNLGCLNRSRSALDWFSKAIEIAERHLGLEHSITQRVLEAEATERARGGIDPASPTTPPHEQEEATAVEESPSPSPSPPERDPAVAGRVRGVLRRRSKEVASIKHFERRYKEHRKRTKLAYFLTGGRPITKRRHSDLSEEAVETRPQRPSFQVHTKMLNQKNLLKASMKRAATMRHILNPQRSAAMPVLAKGLQRLKMRDGLALVKRAANASTTIRAFTPPTKSKDPRRGSKGTTYFDFAELSLIHI
eukprot:TRINITY_DN14009_c0_g1_i1.p1 TRINITY_DN14009_c0_g1~~TRINITY_DN14009_c0_g1_i1.p1  ORF type:complete len:353 (-),score=95.52 TRINITY_DN14009_c0_g1_i1:191-1249(-)